MNLIEAHVRAKRWLLGTALLLGLELRHPRSCSDIVIHQDSHDQDQEQDQE